MKLKNHFIISIIVLLLSISFVASPLTVSANSYNKAYVTKNITVYRFIAGNCFANSRLGNSLRLNKWKTITIKPFYHMGKDGYFLHVAGHGTTIYYARTNSTHWFKVGALSLNSATPQAFKTVSDNSFDFNKYVPGFLTAGNVATVYTTVNDAATQTGKTYTLKNIYKKMLVQRNNGGKWNTLKINYDGKILYYVNSDGVIRPYNTYRDADPFDSTIDSPYSPNSYSKIYMKNGNHIYNGTHWDKVVTYGNGGNSVFVTQSYICKNGHWFKTK